MPRPPLRVIVTPPASGRHNVALDQALIERHRTGTTPDTLRFLSFSPSVLIGRHQDLSREVDLDYCAAKGIDVGRRVTGGGAIYLDGGQFGWELIVTRARVADGDLGRTAAAICETVADALNDVGVAAAFRPRNDLEVAGRKIGGTGGFHDGDTLFYQGTLLLELDTDTMFRALRVPPEKRARHGGSAAARVTSVAAVARAAGRAAPSTAAIQAALAARLAARFGYDAVAADIDASESAAAKVLRDDEIGTTEFVHELDGITADDGWHSATRQTPGGAVTASVRRPPRGQPAIDAVLLSGDFFVTPPRLVFDLEAALKGCALDAVAATVDACLERADIDLLSLTAADISATIIEAAGTGH